MNQMICYEGNCSKIIQFFLFVQAAKEYLLNSENIDINGEIVEDVAFQKWIDVYHSNTANLVYLLQFYVELVPTPLRPEILFDACSLDVIEFANRVSDLQFCALIKVMYKLNISVNGIPDDLNYSFKF